VKLVTNRQKDRQTEAR